MKQVLIKHGQAILEEVPAPTVEPGAVLVRVHYSCISSGTELSGIKSSGMPLWKRALKQPENLKKLIRMVAAQGLAKTYSMVEGKLSSAHPTGYSAAGIVQEIGDGIDDLRPGDRVACGGAQYAHHAEIIRVPRNLVVHLPDTLDLMDASTVTLGAIALQGVRRAQPSLGETFVVIGLGILGQLTVQLLKANGCRVIGTDLDRSRIHLAEKLGLCLGAHPDDGYDVEQVGRLTNGVGADGVIITATTSSDSVVSAALRMCRKKGRVVLVGNVGLNLNRRDFYEKELDFLMSTSYGPGRYDNSYEEKGLDYPVAYVRWTENRNMEEYVRLVADGKITVSPLITATYSVDQATIAYASLEKDDAKPLMVVLSYPQAGANVTDSRVVTNPAARPKGPHQVRIAVIGAGEFAKSTQLPNLQALSDRYHIQAVVSRTGSNALNTARQVRANYATTDYRQVLRDPDVDAVLIATRHNLHALLAVEALKAGKHVFVEKPLALTRAELDEIKSFYAPASSGSTLPILMAGFNRRFSCHAKRIREIVQGRSNPLMLSYRMNAGYVPLNHWIHTEEGGGRNRGEACHIYDLFTFLTESQIATVEAQAIAPQTAYYSRLDNFIATITFRDGSVASLTYTALGTAEYPKERLEVFVDGKVIVLDDYRQVTVAGARQQGIETRAMAKGQREELEAFACAIQQGGEWPIPLWQQIQATEMALLVEERIRNVA